MVPHAVAITLLRLIDKTVQLCGLPTAKILVVSILSVLTQLDLIKSVSVCYQNIGISTYYTIVLKSFR